MRSFNCYQGLVLAVKTTSSINIQKKSLYCDAKNVDEEIYLEAGQIFYIFLSNKKQPMNVEKIKETHQI